MNESAARPSIVLISTGGTIATARRRNGVAPVLSGADLLSGVPGVAEVADVAVIDYCVKPSPYLLFEDIVEIHRIAARSIDSGADAVIVTQGTDSMEEIAFGLSILWSYEAALVVTGAMRDASQASCDGPGNLLAAARVAASKDARCAGVLVVMQNEIHSARFVRKTHSYGLSAFASPLVGPIGWTVEDRVRIVSRVPALETFQNRPLRCDAWPAVCLLKTGIDDDGRLLQFLREVGYEGVVIEGFGGGHLPQRMAESDVLTDLAQSIPVVLASRSGAGELPMHTYSGYAGSETSLFAAGLISAGALDGVKARVLLTMLLCQEWTLAEIRGIFDDYVGLMPAGLSVFP